MSKVDILSLDQLSRIAEKVVKLSRSSAVEVQVSSSHNANIRFAANTVTTSGSSVGASLSITAIDGKRSGSVSTNDISDEGLLRACRRAEEIASLAPENSELMQPLREQPRYLNEIGFDDATADGVHAAGVRSGIAGSAIKLAKAEKLVGSGFLHSSVNHAVYLNSNKVLAPSRTTRTTFSTTMRNAAGTSSGWSKRASNEVGGLDAEFALRTAAEKCKAWQNPRELDPGRYKVVLEPSAAADLVQQFAWSLDARSAEEGRSAFARPGGKTALGEKVVSEMVTIRSQPDHAELPASVHAGGGEASETIDWVRDGELKNLTRSRFWAEKSGGRSVPGPANLIMQGGSDSMENLIRNVDAALLVTSFWYIRDVDQQTLVKTGLTRDGLFWIEDGVIRHGVVNFRWNESPINLLKNVIALSTPHVTAPRDGWDGMPMLVPMIYASEFNFSSLSDAV